MEATHSTKIGFRDEPVQVKCLRCGYPWLTRTMKRSCSCPDCRYLNNVEKAIENAKKSGENNAE